MDILFARWLKCVLYLTVLGSLACGCFARGQDSGHLYVTNESLNTIDVIRASDHVRVASIPTITTPYGAAITRNGKRLYVSSWNHMAISEFDTETNSLVSVLGLGSQLREATLTPDERYLYVPDYNQNVVHVVSTGGDKLALVADIPVGINPHMVAFGGNGRYAYVTNEFESYVSVIDTHTRTMVCTIPVGQTPTELASSPDTQTIYVAAFSAASIAVISVKSQSVVGTISLPSDPYAVAASPDGRFLYVTAAFPTAGYEISPADNPSWGRSRPEPGREISSSHPMATPSMRRISTPRTITRSTPTHFNWNM